LRLLGSVRLNDELAMTRNILKFQYKSDFINSIRWKFDFKKVNKFIISYLMLPFGGRNYRKFFILTRSRTGSNLLVDFLNSNKRILTRNEMFRNLNGKDHRKILNKIFRRYPYFIEAVGFKIFYNHPFDSQQTSLWDELAQEKDMKVIHLVRENILRSFVSHKIAEKTNTWFKKNSSRISAMKTNSKSIRLDAEKLQNEIAQTYQWQQEGEERFKEHRILKISYEELTQNPDKTFAKVCDFLGVPFKKPNSSFKRQNPERLEELIENYQEMKDLFSNSEFASFFED
jgi:LPS sulfotransferase NodH